VLVDGFLAEAEVGQFDVAVSVQEDVLWLQVPERGENRSINAESFALHLKVAEENADKYTSVQLFFPVF